MRVGGGENYIDINTWDLDDADCLHEIDAVVIASSEPVDAVSDIFHRKYFGPVIAAEELSAEGVKKEKAVKAAVFTFFNVDENYGQTLQAYAVQRVLFGLGIDNVIVNFSYRALAPRHVKNIFRPGFKRRAGFRRFIFQRLKRTKPCRSKQDIAEALKEQNCNAIVCGSDQIWNYYNHRFDGDMYFANFPGLWRLRKVSYAASIGVCAVSGEEKRKFKHQADLISRFDAVSVREESGRQILQEFLPEKKAECLIDPVFMLRADRWRRLAKKMKLRKPFILCYCVGNISKYRRFFTRLVKEAGSTLYFIGPAAKDSRIIGGRMIQPDPAEFLWCMDHADYVAGDSFHLAAFALIFHKQFYLVQRDETRVGGYDKDGRLSHLESLFGFGNRYIKTEEKDFMKLPPVDFHKTDMVIAEERKKAKRFLKHALLEDMV